MRRTHYFLHFLKTWFFKNFSNVQFWLENPWKWLFESLKILKSPPPHVWDRRNRFTRRTTTPVDSSDTHGPKHVLESIFWILKVFQNFFRALQVKTSHLLECIFWWFQLDFHENPWKSLKIMQKSLPPHVWVIKNRLVQFPTTPRTLLDSLGPKLPCTNLFDHNLMRRTHYFLHFWKLDFSKIPQMFNFGLKILENCFLTAWKS